MQPLEPLMVTNWGHSSGIVKPCNRDKVDLRIISLHDGSAGGSYLSGML